MLSKFLLLLYLFPPTIYLSATPSIGYGALDSSSERYCSDTGVDCGAPAMERCPSIPVDPHNESRSPKITCSHGHALLNIGSLQYRISKIDCTSQTLLISNVHYDNLNSTSCSPFSISADLQDVGPTLSYTQKNQLLTLLYHCSPGVKGFHGVQELWCSDTSAGLYYYSAIVPGFFESECESVTYAVVGSVNQLSSSLEGGGETLGTVACALRGGFEVTWTRQERRGCDACSQSGGIGCRNHSFLVLCQCPDNHTYVHMCPVQTGNSEQNVKGHLETKSLVKILIGGTGSILFVCLLLLYMCHIGKLNITTLCRRKEQKKGQKLEAFMEKFGHLAPTRYSYSDVEKITSSFNQKIGQGGYGAVYKGKLDNGHLVAVKVLNSSKGGGKEFFSEVISIGCTYHVNIVSLIGFCLEGSRRILIYELMANGSLDKFIYIDKQSLKCEKLLHIAIGIARGLDYLHHGCNIGILHFDIKPHNILLDEDSQPKISDFGLAKLCRSGESIISMLEARGTVGYIAPEVFSRNFGGVSSKADVYSYGMLLLEMVGGRKNLKVQVDNTSEIYFSHWIYKHLNLDGNLINCRVISKDEEEIARRMILVGLWCIQTKPTDRPSMGKVIDMLEKRILDLQIPPMPTLSSPSRSVKNSGTSDPHEIISVVTC